jgi:polysaccharide deacetylase 2 family uncharacterized protein YibQ
LPPLDKDIDKPLGKELAGKRPREASWRPDAKGVLMLAGAIGIVGASVALALRDEGFRRATPTAVELTGVPEAAGEGGPDAGPAAREAASSSGPSIIRVEPPGDGAQARDVVIIRDPAAIGQNPRVAHLPDRDLIEETEFGPLPKRAEDGRRPFDVYARPWSGARGARIAIVIGGLGLSQTGTQNAIERLPGEVTLAFAPQGNSLQRWMEAARRDGHEIIMQIPLEPFDYPRIDPGRNTLTLDAGTDANLDRLRWALGRTTNYTGVMNYMGARFVADRAAFEPVLDEIGRRGLLYLDDGTSARSLSAKLAAERGVPLAAGDTVIDSARERGEILKKLDELERIARAKGLAVGTGTAFDLTVATVADWIGEARRRGIEIVPVSAVAADPERK